MVDELLNDEVNFEPEEELGDLGAAQAKIKKVKDELAKVKQEKQEYLDGWQRCKADSINARREALESGERQGARAVESLLEELLPVLDGFDIAAGSESWASIGAEWRSGMEQIRNQLLDVLARHDITRFGKVGDMLDPRLHEAIQEVDDIAGEPHSIIKILRYGYSLRNRTLRAAQVIVKSGKA
jgi:molecular chaperone GrpE